MKTYKIIAKVTSYIDANTTYEADMQVINKLNKAGIFAEIYLESSTLNEIQTLPQEPTDEKVLSCVICGTSTPESYCKTDSTGRTTCVACW